MTNNIFNLIINDCSEISDSKKFNFFKNKKILITGSTGLLGHYFIAFFINLLKSKSKPKKITLLHKSSLPGYLKFLNKNKYFAIKRVNLSKENFKNFEKYDCIIHAATYAQPSEFIKNSLETINLNTFVTYKLIKLLKPKGKFLFISSSEIYSGIKDKIISENFSGVTTPEHIRACYIESKRCGETIVNEFRKEKIDAVSARLCLAYGPGFKINDERVLSQFIKRALKEKKLEISKGQSNIRSYIYITDVIRMLLNILLIGKRNVYNIGGKSKISILDLGKKISKLTSAKFLSRKNEKNKDGAPAFAKISIKNYEKEFGKIKFTNLNDGLNKTIEWYKSLLV
tara:strand:+ start:1874 stop:2899 length:1026 start_codon:yes stop_codon:yes gene_type:complete